MCGFFWEGAGKGRGSGFLDARWEGIFFKAIFFMRCFFLSSFFFPVQKIFSLVPRKVCESRGGGGIRYQGKGFRGGSFSSVRKGNGSGLRVGEVLRCVWT